MTPAGAYGKWIRFAFPSELLLAVLTDFYGSPAWFEGSYAGAGYLLATLDLTDSLSEYTRWLDLNEAVSRTTWSDGSSTFLRFVIPCSI